VRRKEVVFETDEGVRYDANIEGFAKLKPFFTRRNGHGGKLVANVGRRGGGRDDVVEKAEELGLKPLARFVLTQRRVFARRNGHRSGLRDSEGFKDGWLDARQIDVIELNEAFAAQGLAVMKSAGNESGKSERQWRRGRARTSARLHRS
jgi:acetyl-CoA acyltransferase